MTDPTTSALATSPRRIAVVGLGNMGGPMAANLEQAGQDFSTVINAIREHSRTEASS